MRKITEEDIKKVKLSDKTLKTIRYSRMGVELVANVGVSKLINKSMETVIATMPLRGIEKVAIKIGGFFAGALAANEMSKMFDKVEALTIATAQGYIAAREEVTKIKEEENGTESDAESEE